MLAKDYSKALERALKKNPTRGATFLRNLRASLKRRGHERLLPHIFHEYQKLQIGKSRAEASRRVTPEGERTRILLELYKKLIKNSSNSSL